MRIGRAMLDDRACVVAEHEGRWRALGLAMDEVVGLGRAGLEACFSAGRPIAPPEHLLAPLRPRQVIAVGLNYADHVRESGLELPEAPLLFSKLPSTVIGPRAAIEIDPDLSAQVDYEVELAAVIGRPPPPLIDGDPLDHVFGYAVANDVSARDVQLRDGQWTRGKGLRTFCPLGPMVVAAHEVPDPQALSLATAINGEEVQRGSTADMVFDVRSLIATCARSFDLWPGDVILTGTPAGVGVARRPPRFLADGDTVHCTVDGVGRLSNPVRAVSAGAVR